MHTCHASDGNVWLILWTWVSQKIFRDNPPRFQSRPHVHASAFPGWPRPPPSLELLLPLEFESCVFFFVAWFLSISSTGCLSRQSLAVKVYTDFIEAFCNVKIFCMITSETDQGPVIVTGTQIAHQVIWSIHICTHACKSFFCKAAYCLTLQSIFMRLSVTLDT